MKDRAFPLSARGTSVKEDWRAWLPEGKAQVFHSQVRDLDSTYTMFSVSLNEAMELRRAGQLGKSLLAVGITSELSRLLTEQLAGVLRGLSLHARHYGTVPNVAPLDPANFQGPREQRLARISALLNHVLFSHRLQFLYKVGTLEDMVENLGKDFREAADDLSGGICVDPQQIWGRVDADHYDLNTCLREAIVLLKSFLIVLPEEQLLVFQDAVRDQCASREAYPTTHRSAVRHRRIGAIAGE